MIYKELAIVQRNGILLFNHDVFSAGAYICMSGQ